MLSCSIQPDSIYYGEDICSACKMTIVDRQHAAQLITAKGKAFKFDAIECMLRNKKENEQYHYLLVNDYLQPGDLIDAQKAVYLVSEEIPSPMGANLTAFSDVEAARSSVQSAEGKLFSWEEIQQRTFQLE
ncbi:MAG: hypothetical protein HKN76_11595 [Saprospiraceae bacterium]|nr:hypothetical protein [Saprospiraceae bacterium]